MIVSALKVIQPTGYSRTSYYNNIVLYITLCSIQYTTGLNAGVSKPHLGLKNIKRTTLVQKRLVTNSTN